MAASLQVLAVVAALSLHAGCIAVKETKTSTALIAQRSVDDTNEYSNGCNIIWSPWSPCTQTCGSGTKERTGRNSCTNKIITRTRTCKKKLCSSVSDCNGSWSSWSMCSCGSVQTRIYTVADPKSRPSCYQHGQTETRACAGSCIAGQYGRDGLCRPCPPGNMCGSCSVEPIPCTPGNFQFLQRRSFCKVCAKGTYQLRSGATGCITCPTGHMCPIPSEPPIPCPVGHYQGDIRQASCKQCPDGYYQDKVGQKSCKLCPAGHACLSKTSLPIPCAPGQHQRFRGRTTCAHCPLGSYQVEFGAKACNLCPVGHACASTTASPVACALGQYQPSKKKTTCIQCAEGRYQSDNGGTSCNICPKDHMCPTSTAQPIPCPAGTYQSRQGKTFCQPFTVGVAVSVMDNSIQNMQKEPHISDTANREGEERESSHIPITIALCVIVVLVIIATSMWIHRRHRGDTDEPLQLEVRSRYSADVVNYSDV